jgi:phosphate transport system permease protein
MNDGSSLQLRKSQTWPRFKEQAIRFLLFCCAAMSIVTTIAIITVLVTGAVEFFQKIPLSDFLLGTEWYPLSGKPKYGVLPLVWDTFMVAGIAGIFGLPTGLAIAIYLSEYATPRARNVVKPILEILAGIPTIVYGFFALTFITPVILQPIFRDLLGWFNVGQFNALSAGIVVGIMVIPMVSSLSEDVLRAVPRGLREAGYALGSTRLDVSMRVVVPAALSGIIAAFLLALSRAIGETMAVTLAAGMRPNLTLNVFDSVQTMTAFIVNITSGDVEVGSPAEKSLYAVGLTLFLMTLVMNILSQMVLRRFRQVYQ